jgi:hypothetical protein
MVTSEAEADLSASGLGDKVVSSSMVPALQQPRSGLLVTPKAIRSLARESVFEHMMLDANWLEDVE